MSTAVTHQPERLGLAGRMALTLFRIFPARASDSSPGGNRPAVEYEDEVAHSTLAFFLRDASWLAGKDVVDLGSGYGGRTVRYAEQGAKSVVGIEIDHRQVDQARQFSIEKGSKAQFLLGTGENIPLPDSSADLILMYDVMEHVVDPKEIVAECYRVLRPDGELAVVFPPYYSFHGGSHLHGYACRLPAMNLLFPSGALKLAAKARLQEMGRDVSLFRDIPTDPLWSVNGTTIRRWNAIIKESRFRTTYRDDRGFFCNRLRRGPAIKRFFGLPFYWFLMVTAATPMLREAACARIVHVLKK